MGLFREIMGTLILLFGVIIGSFLNVCIYRIPRKESIAFGASHCTKCGNRIKWYDLIPIISYLILRGKCRVCKEKISLQYPLIELTNGLAYFGLYRILGATIWFFISCVVFSILLVTMVIFIQKKKD